MVTVVAVCSALHNDTNEIEAPLLEMVAMDKEMATSVRLTRSEICIRVAMDIFSVLVWSRAHLSRLSSRLERHKRNASASGQS